MEIGPVELLVSQDGDDFDFTINFSLSFSQAEVDGPFEFEHGIVFWEGDAGEPFGGGDDKLFTVPNRTINPSSTFVPLSRNQPLTFTGTELGGEEVWAEVYARNKTTGGQVISRRSPVLQLAV